MMGITPLTKLEECGKVTIMAVKGNSMLFTSFRERPGGARTWMGKAEYIPELHLEQKSVEAAGNAR